MQFATRLGRHLAPFLILVLGIVGCRAPFLFWGPTGSGAQGDRMVGSGLERLAVHERDAVLMFKIKWPERDYPGFRAAAIPTSTRALVVTITGQGRNAVSETFERPAIVAVAPEVRSMRVPEGNNLTVEVKAYREYPVPQNASPIAIGTVPNVAAPAGARVPVAITLAPVDAPRITGLSVKGSPTNTAIEIYGENFGVGEAVFKVKFTDENKQPKDALSVARQSAATASCVVPAGAVTGPLVIEVDGIGSSGPNVIYWVMGDSPIISLNYRKSQYDPLSKAVNMQVGESVTLLVNETVNDGYVFPTGTSLTDYPDFGPKPVREYLVTPPDKGSFADAIFSATAEGSADLKVKIGSVYSNAVTATISGAWRIFALAGSGAAGGQGMVGDSLSSPTGIAFLPDGSLLVADQSNNVLRSLTTDDTGALAILAGTGGGGFVNAGTSSAMFNSPTGVAVTASGDILVADQGNNVIRKISGGLVTTYAGGGSSNAPGGDEPTNSKFNRPSGLTISASGDVIVSDSNFNRIRMIASTSGSFYGQGMTAGKIYTVVGPASIDPVPPPSSTSVNASDSVAASPPPEAPFNGPGGVAVAPDGTIFVADTGNHRIRQIDPLTGGVSTIAGTGAKGFAGDGEAAASAELDSPTDVAYVSGTLYVADRGNNRVRSFTVGGGITTVVGTGVAGSAGDGAAGAASTAQLNRPYGLAVGSGYLYVSEGGSNRIRRVTLADGSVSTVNKAVGTGATAAEIVLGKPAGVAVGSGSLYIVDTDQNLVRKIEPIAADGSASIVAGTGVPGAAGDGGAATSAQLNNPIEAVLDGQNHLYIIDQGSKLVRVVAAKTDLIFGANVQAGNIYTVAGETASGSALGQPVGLAFLPGGDMLVSDSGNHVVKRISRTTGAATVFAGVTGNGNFGGDGSSATGAFLNGPRGLAILADGSVLIADGLNRRIRKVKTDGNIVTVAGNDDAAYGSENVAATNTALSSPWAIVADTAGGFYFTDMGHHVVRWVTPSGTITTIAGTPETLGFAGDGGPARQARIYSPKGLARDSAGNLYLADTLNNRIRRLGRD